jgi:hypothetical protein
MRGVVEGEIFGKQDGIAKLSFDEESGWLSRTMLRVNLDSSGQCMGAFCYILH